jgi:hypothetical protein
MVWLLRHAMGYRLSYRLKLAQIHPHITPNTAKTQDFFRGLLMYQRNVETIHSMAKKPLSELGFLGFDDGTIHTILYPTFPPQ